MLDPGDLWMMEELTIGEPADLLLTVRETRELLDPNRDDEEHGLRSILERPEVLSKAWQHCTHAERHGVTSKAAKRDVGVRRAA